MSPVGNIEVVGAERELILGEFSLDNSGMNKSSRTAVASGKSLGCGGAVNAFVLTMGSLPHVVTNDWCIVSGGKSLAACGATSQF